MLVVLTREAGFNDELIRWVGDAGEVVEAPLTTTAYRDVADVAKDIDGVGARRELRHARRHERAGAALRGRRGGGAGPGGARR